MACRLVGAKPLSKPMLDNIERILNFEKMWDKPLALLY